MEDNFFDSPRGMMALAAFIVGALLYSVPAMQQTLAEVPWEYMPQASLEASASLYDATFMRVAETYVAFANGVADIQAQAYVRTGTGLSAAAALAAETGPLAGVVEWYQQLYMQAESKLTSQ